MPDDKPPETSDAGSDAKSAWSDDAFLRRAAASPERAPPRGHDLEAGAHLGHFRVFAKIGQGGMGVVYKAMDEKLRRTIALKVLPPLYMDDEGRRRRFLREARSLAAVVHANIATIHDVGEAEGRVFIAMEYVEGKSLRTMLASGALPIAEALRIAQSIARGLSKAHEKGVVHRDLKPDNVMISKDGEVKILDFGLAKLRGEGPVVPDADTASQLTQEGHVLGTPGYMSPEQATGREVDARSDVFSLGIVLYEMLTGTRPFKGETSLEVLVAVSRDEPEPMSKHNPAVPPELQQVVTRCLAKLPDARYASAAELLGALEPLISEGARSAPPAAPQSITALDALEALPEVVPSRTRTLWYRGLIAVVLVAAVALGARFLLPHPGAGVPANASVHAPPQPRPTAITDLPIPSSKIPVAASAFFAGLQSLRDDNYEAARRNFRRAAELDPTMAAAHLRLALLTYELTPSEMREHFAKASEFRTQLSERDVALMTALEPVVQRQPKDRVESSKRLVTLSEKYPLDAELFLWISQMHMEDPEGALAAARHAVELDDRYATAWELIGRTLAALGRTDEARAAFDRCTATSFGTTDCLSWRAVINAVEGRCDDCERESRRMLDRDLSDYTNYRQLAAALWAVGRPPEAVKEVLYQGRTKLPEPALTQTKLRDEALLASAIGDFTHARELGRAFLHSISSASSARPHYVATQLLVSIALEINDTADASVLARDYVKRRDAWVESESIAASHWTPWLLHLARDARALTQPEFERQRGAWIERYRGNLVDGYRGLLWAYAYAAPADTAAEAAHALAVLPDYQPLTSFTTVVPDAEIGKVYLLAGQVDDAIAHLRKAAAHCYAFFDLFSHTHALWNLGQALERKADTAGACEAYGRVVDRWGRAKPRSVTAEKSRERMKLLACAK